MDDKCILVTGSSSGIGRSIVIKLLETGARVIGLARDHSKFKLKNTNYVYNNILSIPLHNHLYKKDTDFISNKIKSILIKNYKKK